MNQKQPRTMWLAAIFGGVGAAFASGLAASACSTNENTNAVDATVDTTVDSVVTETAIDASAGPPPCTATWCASVASYCQSFVPCLGLPSDADISQCTNGLGSIIQFNDAGESPAALASTLLGCAQDASSCFALDQCGQLLQQDAAVDAGAPVVDARDSGMPVDSNAADVGYLPEGAVPIWGTDNLLCVDCAYSQCNTVLSHCFVDTSTTPGCIVDGGKAYPDCCKDYRQCLAQCSQWSLGDGGSYALCASQRCDVDYPNGRIEFGPYQTCMVAKCAGCAGGDAGGPG
ncbi:MAG: hypothetical protein ACHREM_09960 [Polyangiales bacterium]